MMKLVVAAVVLLVATEGALVKRQDDNSTIAVPPNPTNTPPKANTTDAVTMMVTSDAPDVTDDVVGNTTVPVEPVTTNNTDTSTFVTSVVTETSTTPVATTTDTTPLPCQLASDKIAAVFSFTQTPEFKELSQNEQIVVYELLAAGENCKMKDFITAKTAERIFRLLTDLPLKRVYTFVSFVSESLANEGVIVPE
ncbi:hypothetical protein EGW08_004798 [Elysia chlorotica]|uniref:Uncharacterized protein n=1 Tax=Elysia chlorotica TaxID=188477 RepID=A0A433U0S4_ELYCH|nr:hypothetical protein EGW08_004798 [Elysia chlorotica]